jgi:hypothetical protein
MPKKDTEWAILIQNSAQTFVDFIQQAIGHIATISSSTAMEVASSAKSQDITGPESELESGSGEESGPTRYGLSRLQLGLAIRSAGALFPFAIEFATSQLICEVLNDFVREDLRSRPTDTGGGVNTGGGRDVTTYEEVVDALVAACGLPKMRLAAEKHHVRISSSSIRTSARLVGVLSHIADDKESSRRGGGGTGSHITNGKVREILRASNALVEAIELLGLTEAYSMVPLLSGEDVKKILVNIPKGSAFGDVMQAQVRWMLCNPTATKEEAALYLSGTFPSYR